MISSRIQNQRRKFVILAFSFLNTKHVRFVFINPRNECVHSNANRIHVVGCQFHYECLLPHSVLGVTESLLGRQSLIMGGNMAENSSSSVASVAIVVIILLAIFAFYFLFGRGVHAKRDINIDIKGPS